MPNYLWNLLFGQSNKAGLNIKSQSSLHATPKSTCDLINKPDRLHQIKDIDIIPTVFKVKIIKDDLHDLNLKFIRLIHKKNTINDYQKPYLNKVSVCQSKLLMHPSMTFTDPLDNNILVFVVFTTKSNDVLVFPDTYQGINELDRMKVLSVSNYIDKAQESYYEASKAYSYILESSESFSKNDLLKPMDNDITNSFFKDKEYLYHLYVERTKVALNVRLNNDVQSINVNGLASEHIYKVVSYNKETGKLSEMQWDWFQHAYVEHQRKVNALFQTIKDE